ncbi:hypothetical protein [Aggregatilinea lenta]|uniref:hypothetical protein n=1 Tax=Aggregatilinea lenta TaxID=913108 RepID=UPI0013C2F119|nr:hypothetical protein [Aggregatilinea lenta]
MTGAIGWRVWLSGAPLYAVDLLAHDPLIIAAWTSPRDVFFFGAYDAEYLGQLTIPAAPASDPAHGSWRDFLDGLRAPDGTWLPVVPAGMWRVLTSHDGQMRVIHSRQDILIEIDGDIIPLARDGDESLAAVALDRELGTVAALDGRSHVQFFQQALAMGAFPLDGKLPADGCFLALPDASDAALVVGAGQALLVDTSGQIHHRLALGASPSAMAAASSGGLVLVAEGASLRVMSAELTPLRQASGPSLLAVLDPLDDETAGAPIDSSLPVCVAAAAADGVIAFGLGGTLGVTAIEALNLLPQPRPLL